MREFILDFTVREAYAGDKLVWDVDECADLYVHVLALLMELALRLLHLVLVSSNEKCGHVVRIWELPWAEVLLLEAHILEIVDHLRGFSGLLETLSKQIRKFSGVG